MDKSKRIRLVRTNDLGATSLQSYIIKSPKKLKIIPDKIAANKKNGHNLILSANVPDTIETVVAQKTIWKYQSDPSA